MTLLTQNQVRPEAPPVPAQQAQRWGADAPLVVGVLNGKGGAGKTTTVLGLAAAAVGEGFGVVIVDADRQGSAYKLTQGMLAPPGYEVVQEDNPAALCYLHDTPGAEIVLVDTPGSLAEGGVIDYALKHVDLIVIPSDMSTMSSGPTMDTVDFVVRRGATPNVLLNAIGTGARLERQAREYLTTYPVRADDSDGSPVIATGVACLDGWVRRYVAHGNAISAGVPITEWEGLNAVQARTDLLAVLYELLRARPDLEQRVRGRK